MRMSDRWAESARRVTRREPSLERAPYGSLAEVHRSLGWMAVWVARTPADLDLVPSGHRVRLSLPAGRDVVTVRADAHVAVNAYVVGLRAEGVPPQRMLILVKEAAREAARSILEHGDLVLLVDLVVGWSIKAYYGAERGN